MLTEKQKQEIQELEDRIVEIKNSAFANSSQAKQRVAIAKDVLAQLRAKKFLAQTGYWVELSYANPGARVFHKEDDEIQLCDAVEKGKATCNVCALGGLFMAAVQKHDKYTLADFGGGKSLPINQGFNQISDYLESWFSREQLALIEMAFEQNGGWCQNLSEFSYIPGREAAKTFAPHIRGETDRLKAIMQNIIANKGTFCPEKGVPVRSRSKP